MWQSCKSENQKLPLRFCAAQWLDALGSWVYLARVHEFRLSLHSSFSLRFRSMSFRGGMRMLLWWRRRCDRRCGALSWVFELSGC